MPGKKYEKKNRKEEFNMAQSILTAVVKNKLQGNGLPPNVSIQICSTDFAETFSFIPKPLEQDALNIHAVCTELKSLINDKQELQIALETEDLEGATPEATIKQFTTDLCSCYQMLCMVSETSEIVYFETDAFWH